MVGMYSRLEVNAGMEDHVHSRPLWTELLRPYLRDYGLLSCDTRCYLDQDHIGQFSPQLLFSICHLWRTWHDSR